MKWKLTGRFLISVVFIVIFVTIINSFVILAVFIAQVSSSKPFFGGNETTNEEFTRDFNTFVTVSKDHIGVSEEGKKELKKKNAWIQILDENGNEIYRHMTPKEVKTKYSPLEIIQMYKYKEIDSETNVYIGGEMGKYSYFIGIKDSNTGKYVFSYDNQKIINQFKAGSIFFLVINGLVALFIGYLFSKRLTKPLNKLIVGIKSLANKNYINYETNGIYKDVFYHVNQLSYQLKAHEKEREKIDNMKEEWISNISHDIKTPLASIQGFAEIMKDKEYDFSLEEMRDYAEIIERKAIYMKEVLDDLNLSTRLKNQELTLNKKSINIVSLLRNIVIDTLNDSSYANRNIEFHCSEEIINIEADEILLRRAITNLIYNAVVHNDEDVKINVKVEKNERTNIWIEDHGKGIKKEELERIFDRYYRGTNTGKSNKGSGLGMAIAKDIVEAHGGDIKINSVVDEGTSIEIAFI